MRDLIRVHVLALFIMTCLLMAREVVMSVSVVNTLAFAQGTPAKHDTWFFSSSLWKNFDFCEPTIETVQSVRELQILVGTEETQ
jgi:hypothetical protein